MVEIWNIAIVRLPSERFVGKVFSPRHQVTVHRRRHPSPAIRPRVNRSCHIFRNPFSHTIVAIFHSICKWDWTMKSTIIKLKHLKELIYKPWFFHCRHRNWIFILLEVILLRLTKTNTSAKLAKITPLLYLFNLLIPRFIRFITINQDSIIYVAKNESDMHADQLYIFIWKRVSFSNLFSKHWRLAWLLNFRLWSSFSRLQSSLTLN